MATNYPVDDDYSILADYPSSTDSESEVDRLTTEVQRWGGASSSYGVNGLAHLLQPVPYHQLGPLVCPTGVNNSREFSGKFNHSKELVEVTGKESYCKSYQIFRGKLKNLAATYKLLDPLQSRQFVKGDKFDLDTNGMMMLQGGVIHALASWEEFIVDIIKEGYKTFVEIGSGSPPNLYSLKERLPSCETILRKEVKNTCLTRSVDETMYSLLWRINAPPQFAYSAAAPWAEYFEAHCQTTISSTQLVPVFAPGAQNSIDSLFSKLFQVTAVGSSLSEQILSIGRFRFKLQLNQGEAIDLQISSVTALRNISRLYYALRCVFAHGHNQRTITGALKDFPRNVAEFELGNEKAAKYFLGLYRRIDKYGRDASISYLTFVNMIEFLKRAAFFLMRAIAKKVYDATETCIWSYKPHSAS